MRKSKIEERVGQNSLDIGSIYRSIEHINKRLLQLECPHKHAEFGVNYPIMDSYIKVCKDCGKTLASYDTEKEMLEAKLEYQKEQCEKELVSIKKDLKDA